MADITGIAPDHGPLAGGNTVIITGIGFTGASTVDFGPFAASFSVDSDTQITATAPDASSTTGGGVVISIDGSGFDADGIYTFDLATVIGGPPPPIEPCLTLTVPGFVADTITADIDGVAYTVQAIDGWFDSPPVRSGTREAQGQGETVTVNRENARPVDVVILAHAPDRSTPLGNLACFSAIEAIKTAFRAVFIPVLMDVVDPSGQERTMLARRVGPIKSQILGNGAAVLFNIPMLGENPVLVVV